jgi:hypothetical protein
MFAELLYPVLAESGWELSGLTGFACFAPPGRKVKPNVREPVSTFFLARGWKMVWSEETADTSLIQWVQGMLWRRELPQHVLLVTNDQDFGPLADELREHGKKVYVSGRDVSRRLRDRAHGVIPFAKFQYSLEQEDGNGSLNLRQ